MYHLFLYKYNYFYIHVLLHSPSYPCNMITVLHVILYYTASQDHRTRERALQLLHILDRRFFASGERGSRRPELLGRITGSTYSNIHVAVSEELAFTNPELTLPLFSGTT